MTSPCKSTQNAVIEIDMFFKNIDWFEQCQGPCSAGSQWSPSGMSPWYIEFSFNHMRNFLGYILSRDCTRCDGPIIPHGECQPNKDTECARNYHI